MHKYFLNVLETVKHSILSLFHFTIFLFLKYNINFHLKSFLFITNISTIFAGIILLYIFFHS